MDIVHSNECTGGGLMCPTNGITSRDTQSMVATDVNSVKGDMAGLPVR